MHARCLVILVSVSASTPLIAGEAIKLPPEVTPTLRAACEHEVRRLCIGDNSTIAKVKSCVEQKFSQLGSRCKSAIISAGLAPD